MKRLEPTMAGSMKTEKHGRYVEYTDVQSLTAERDRYRAALEKIDRLYDDASVVGWDEAITYAEIARKALEGEA